MVVQSLNYTNWDEYIWGLKLCRCDGVGTWESYDFYLGIKTVMCGTATTHQCTFSQDKDILHWFGRLNSQVLLGWRKMHETVGTPGPYVFRELARPVRPVIPVYSPCMPEVPAVACLRRVRTYVAVVTAGVGSSGCRA